MLPKVSFKPENSGKNRDCLKLLGEQSMGDQWKEKTCWKTDTHIHLHVCTQMKWLMEFGEVSAYKLHWTKSLSQLTKLQWLGNHSWKGSPQSITGQ